MKRFPSLELLESTHQFPAPYVFKVIGKSDEGFLGRVLASAREAAELDTDPTFTLRQTSEGKHVSVTLSVEVDSAGRVLAIYERLSELNGLILLM